MVIQRLKNWLKQRRQKRLELQRTFGFNHAAGCMLRGTKPSSLSYLYSTSETFRETEMCRAWDEGMRQAVNQAVSLGWVEDDRP